MLRHPGGALRRTLIRTFQVAYRACNTSVSESLHSSCSGLAPLQPRPADGCGRAPSGRMPAGPTGMHRNHTRADRAHIATEAWHGATATPIPSRHEPITPMATPIRPGRALRSPLCGPPFRVATPMRLGSRPQSTACRACRWVHCPRGDRRCSVRSPPRLPDGAITTGRPRTATHRGMAARPGRRHGGWSRAAVDSRAQRCGKRAVGRPPGTLCACTLCAFHRRRRLLWCRYGSDH